MGCQSLSIAKRGGVDRSLCQRLVRLEDAARLAVQEECA